MSTFDYKYDDLFNPVLQALHGLGGSGTNSEIEERVVALLGLSDRQAEDIHRGNTTKLSYRCAWARNYLKRLGLIENSARAVWALTREGVDTREIDKDQAKKVVKELSGVRAKNSIEKVEESEELVELKWEDELIEVLKTVEPDGFERLSQRLLRELGFQNVEVTGKSADGGIDGVGVIKIGGVLSFHVVFQCKRYSGSVSSPAIRDFRGAMIGRADKGLFITTGTFTRDAKQEAQRDGAPPVDLIDGHAFAEHLKNLRLGVTVEMKEEVTINKGWFGQFWFSPKGEFIFFGGKENEPKESRPTLRPLRGSLRYSQNRAPAELAALKQAAGSIPMLLRCSAAGEGERGAPSL